jgi:hypothetical protein
MSEEVTKYGVKITSPELAKKDLGVSSLTFKTIVESYTIILSWGLHDPKSIADATNKAAKELLNADITTKDDIEEIDQENEEKIDTTEKND